GLTSDELAIALAAENIETRKYYDPPVHRQSAYVQYLTSALTLPCTDLLSSRCLSLPLWSNMEATVVSDICSAVERAFHFAEDITLMLDKPSKDLAYVV